MPLGFCILQALFLKPIASSTSPYYLTCFLLGLHRAPYQYCGNKYVLWAFAGLGHSVWDCCPWGITLSGFLFCSAAIRFLFWASSVLGHSAPELLLSSASICCLFSTSAVLGHYVVIVSALFCKHLLSVVSFFCLVSFFIRASAVFCSHLLSVLSFCCSWDIK